MNSFASMDTGFWKRVFNFFRIADDLFSVCLSHGAEVKMMNVCRQ